MRYLLIALSLLVAACSTPTAPDVSGLVERPRFAEVLMTNAEVLAAFDANQSIKSTRVFGADVTPVKEHGAQTLAFETLRGLIALGITVDEYNQMSQADWEAQVVAAANRMKAYDRPGFNALSNQVSNEWEAAANIGGNYFEHTYDFIIAGSTTLEWVTFTKNGPLTKFRFPNGI
jgi:hypothetical protein